jgi:hypothetical protein
LARTITRIPSPELYGSLLQVEDLSNPLHEEVGDSLCKMAATGADAMVTMLFIYCHQSKPNAVVKLICDSGHLLRPRDAHALQGAALFLLNYPPHLPFVINLIQKELFATVVAAQLALRDSFLRLSEEGNQIELQRLIRLDPAAADREGRIERWVDRIRSPDQGVGLNPMNAFAAAIIGLPMDDDTEAQIEDDRVALDFPTRDYDDDPEMQALREHYRPKLKARFECWVEVAKEIPPKAAATIFSKTYLTVAQRLPFVRAHDIVQEMASR